MAFNGVHTSYMRTVIWMLGELDFDTYFNAADPDPLHNSPAIYIAFSLLMVLMTIIFMNLLVSYLQVVLFIFGSVISVLTRAFKRSVHT